MKSNSMSQFEIWYASPQKFSASFKTPPFTDTGTLTTLENSLRFNGRKNQFDLLSVNSIALTSPPFPLLQFIFVNVLLVGYLAIGVIPSGDVIRISILSCLVVLANVFLIYMFRKKWVEIEFANNQKAYFFDASSLGWGGMLGGNKRIANACQQVAESREC